MSPRPVALPPTPRPAPHRAVLATRAARRPPDAGGSEFVDLDGLAAPLERRGAGSMRSSVNTTICVLEALLGHKRADGGRRRGPRRRPPWRPVRHARSTSARARARRDGGQIGRLRAFEDRVDSTPSRRNGSSLSDKKSRRARRRHRAEPGRHEYRASPTLFRRDAPWKQLRS